jgi:ZIP family zinc transporter
VLEDIIALAGGAILTMIPEAFENSHLMTGLITLVGFLLAFAVSKAGG